MGNLLNVISHRQNRHYQRLSMETSLFGAGLGWISGQAVMKVGFPVGADEYLSPSPLYIQICPRSTFILAAAMDKVESDEYVPPCAASRCQWSSGTKLPSPHTKDEP